MINDKIIDYLLEHKQLEASYQLITNYNNCFEDVAIAESLLKLKVTAQDEKYLREKLNYNGKNLIGDVFSYIQNNSTNVTLYNLNMAVKKIEELRKEGIDFQVSINVNLEDMQNKELIDVIKNLAPEYSKNITFEILENVSISNKEEIKEFVDAIEKAAMKVSYDDVNFNNSAELERIQNLNNAFDGKISKIKIDREMKDLLLNENSLNQDDLAKLSSLKEVLSYCKIANKEIVIEGVENSEELKRINDIIDNKNILIQGWVFSEKVDYELFIKNEIDDIKNKVKTTYGDLKELNFQNRKTKKMRQKV